MTASGSASGSGSGAALLQAAAAARLAADPGLAGVRVFDAAPVRTGLPYVVVDDPVLVDWGAKGWTGREGTLAVLAYDAGAGGGADNGGRPVRLRDLAGAIEGAMPGLDPDLGEGWRIAGLRLSRSRIARAGGDRWLASVEWRVRLYRDDQP